MTIRATVLADSISKHGKRLTTFELYYPRFIHAEELTHRVLSTQPSLVEYMTIPDGLMYDPNLSRNASSSRAIPVKRMLDTIKKDPAIPLRWGLGGAGMQDHGEMSPEGAAAAKKLWLASMNSVISNVGKMLVLNEVPHKQIVNRMLEPWAHITVVVTATEYDNFFALRRHADAQPEIKGLADAMWEARSLSEPRLLTPGEWHLPYIHEWERAAVNDLPTDQQADALMDLIKVSVARCARTSFRTHSNKITSVPEDIALYERLLGQIPLHASPAEHQATPDISTIILDRSANKITREWSCPELSGNFAPGWVQFRKTLNDENITNYTGE